MVYATGRSYLDADSHIMEIMSEWNGPVDDELLIPADVLTGEAAKASMEVFERRPRGR